MESKGFGDTIEKFTQATGIKKLAPAFWHFNSMPNRIRMYAKEAGFFIESSFFNYYFIDKVYILKNGKYQD